MVRKKSLACVLQLSDRILIRVIRSFGRDLTDAYELNKSELVDSNARGNPIGTGPMTAATNFSCGGSLVSCGHVPPDCDGPSFGPIR